MGIEEKVEWKREGFLRFELVRVKFVFVDSGFFCFLYFLCGYIKIYFFNEDR